MTVTIKLVGAFRFGRFKEEIREYPSGKCVQEVVDELRIPESLLGTVLINNIHADAKALLNDGDTLCLLPFIDGG